MNVLVGLMMLLVGLLFLWAFSAVLLSILAGLVTSALLWLPLRFWRRRHLMQALQQNPSLNPQQEAQNHPAWFYLLTAVVIWTGCAAMLFTLIHLPENLYSPDQLVLAAGVAYLVSMWTLIKTLGHWRSLYQPPEEAENTRALWSLAAGLLPMFSLVVWIFLIPSTAGWMVWREEARGYYSTQLRIALNSDDAEHQQALLTLVHPLLEQGSQVMRHTTRSRGSSSSYTLRAALPARYRFEDGALLVQMAGVMPKHQLEQHLQLIDAVSQGAFPGALALAYAQCQPTAQRLQKQRFFGQGSQLMQQVRECVQTRQSELNRALVLLQGQLTVSPPQITSFSPWWSKGRWQAVALPEEDELATLNGL